MLKRVLGLLGSSERAPSNDIPSKREIERAKRLQQAYHTFFRTALQMFWESQGINFRDIDPVGIYDSESETYRITEEQYPEVIAQINILINMLEGKMGDLPYAIIINHPETAETMPKIIPIPYLSKYEGREEELITNIKTEYPTIYKHLHRPKHDLRFLITKLRGIVNDISARNPINKEDLIHVVNILGGQSLPEEYREQDSIGGAEANIPDLLGLDLRPLEDLIEELATYEPIKK